MEEPNGKVGSIGEQNADDYVDLEGADHAAAPLGRSQLGNVDRPEHGRSADAQAAEETEEEQRWPVPGEHAAESGDDIEDGRDAQGFPAAQLLPDGAGGHGAHYRARHGSEDGDALGGAGEVIEPGERVDCTGDDRRIESEEQAAQRAADCRLH